MYVAGEPTASNVCSVGWARQFNEPILSMTQRYFCAYGNNEDVDYVDAKLILSFHVKNAPVSVCVLFISSAWITANAVSIQLIDERS